jgi:hypothetical protein
MAHECLEKRGLTDKRPRIADRDNDVKHLDAVFIGNHDRYGCWVITQANGLGYPAEKCTARLARYRDLTQSGLAGPALVYWQTHYPMRLTLMRLTPMSWRGYSPTGSAVKADAPPSSSAMVMYDL